MLFTIHGVCSPRGHVSSFPGQREDTWAKNEQHGRREEAEMTCKCILAHDVYVLVVAQESSCLITFHHNFIQDTFRFRRDFSLARFLEMGWRLFS